MRAFPTVAVTACLIITGCSRFGSQADLSVAVAHPPEAWIRGFPDLRFEVKFPDASGQWQSASISDLAGSVRISCSKAGNTPVLAYPVAERAAGLLRPAGGLYPWDARQGDGGEIMELSWRKGPVAWIFARLRERGLDTSLVNSARLSAYVDKHSDPWALDLPAIVEKLILGDFSAYDIDPLPARDLNFCPGAGEWFSESPFSPSYPLEERQLLSIPGLSAGTHALFSTQGRRIRIWVGTKETVVGPVE